MTVEVALDTPLADALTNVVQPKLAEVGWNTGLDDSALGEYIILMLVNGKTQDQIAAELSNDLLSLPPEDSGATDFSRWLFEQVDLLNQQMNGAPVAQAQSQSTQPGESGDGQGITIKGASGQIPTGPSSGIDAMDAMEDVNDGSIPTGPKSMRNGSRSGNGNRRMIGQISKAMDRSSDAALHRVRPQQGTERINMHNRQPPKGPRNDLPRNPRMQQNSRSGPMMGNNNGMGPGSFPQMSNQQQMQLMSMYEEQVRIMSQIFAPQMGMNFNQPAINPAFGNNAAQMPGRSLFERVEGNPHRNNNFQKKPQQNGNGFPPQAKPEDSPMNGLEASNGDLTSSMEVEPAQTEPSETACKFNLKCTKQDCPFAHQSPAAPAGAPIDFGDVCSFGAACKNKKCVGKHPSPAQKVGYQTEQDCKFFPNCTNPACPFRHPTMPMCKNGADCSREGCKFTHVRIGCKFNPCLNPQCPYKHAEGQKRGKYGDKVWTADQKEEEDPQHVSERKFVDDDMGEEELVVPGGGTGDQRPESQHSGAEVVT